MLEAKISYPFKLKSHPDRLLNDHLNNVYHIAQEQFDKVQCNFPNFKCHEIKEVVLTAAMYHDFGKATSFFQNYIEHPDKPSNQADRTRRQHGLVSAIMTYQMLKRKFPEQSILPVFGFIIVRRHHGNLENYRNVLMISDDDLQNCRMQAEHIDYQEFRQIVRDQSVNKNLIIGFKENWRQIKRKDRSFTEEHYFVLNLMYSMLLHADKTDAILNKSHDNKSPMLAGKDVRKFKNGLNNNPNNPISAIREKAFHSVEQTIGTLDKKERILSINIPTGSGKTITSLNAALKLCEKFKHDHIVYCLPFTSVIDQNYDVFAKICESAGLPDDSAVLLKHHYLTDINYRSVKHENVMTEYKPNEALYLIEGWESRITVTTFVQFVYSLISFKNASLRKFHRFSNAVIILDEVQSIPHHYWKLIKEMLLKMTEWLNTRIILVTATMPLIFSEKDREIKELVFKKKEIFNKLDRIELDVSNLKQEKMDWNVFCDAAKKLVNDNPAKDILFVMNTIRSAQELYQLFSDLELPHELLFLSAHVIPQQRLKRIEYIKERQSGKPILVISTQLVEAGVDIDLDVVVRDFAPLDSIFQTCGRCNRENRNGVKGKVILFSIKDSNNRVPSGIYQDFLKQKTRKILAGKEIIPESDFFDLANNYFQEVQSGGSQAQSDSLLSRIKELKYADGSQKIELELIDDHYTSSVFIELDDDALRFWNEYQQVMEMEGGFEKNALLKQARRNLAGYIINIPQKNLPAGWNEGIYRIPQDETPQYYDPQTGFKLDTELSQRTETIML